MTLEQLKKIGSRTPAGVFGQPIGTGGGGLVMGDNAVLRYTKAVSYTHLTLPTN